MKAISLWQPWATMVDIGLKQFETRHWATEYRGPLAIHAAQRWTKAQREFTVELFDHPIIGLMLKKFGYSDPGSLPFGAIICTVKLNRILRTEDALATNQADVIERMLGDYSSGRYAWLLLNRKRIQPVPCVGRQGFFNWEPVKHDNS